MKRIIIFTLLVICVCCVSCNMNNNAHEELVCSSPAKIDTIAYRDLLQNPNPLLTVIDIKDCNQEDEPAQLFVRTKGWDDNTYVDLLDKYDIKFHNEYNIDSYKSNRSFNVRRKITMTTNEEVDAPASSVDVTITNGVLPISIIRPYVEECATLPYCYYEDMEIEWNEDSNNSQGVVVLIRWTGAVINGETENTPVYNMCLLEDSGVATLDNAMFDNIPDRAYVTMFLVRASILQVREDQSLVDMQNYDWDAIMEAYPEVLCQTTNVAVGTAAKLSFVLVRAL